jgi:hypothetical protein
MKTLTIFAITLLCLHSSCSAQNKLLDKAKKVVKENVVTPSTAIPSNEEIISGLKEALSNGAKSSADVSSKLDGFNKNPMIFIPFPPETQKMKKKLIDLGMQGKVTEFETSMNRAAEEAAKDAAPIFINAVKNMNVSDGMKILKGSDTSATQYLRENTYSSLIETFKPKVKAAIEKVGVTKYWSPLANTYNKIPLVEKQNPDLDAYVTQLAAQGLFKLIREEEAKIRKDPALRLSDLLKKVFGYADSQKK